MAMGDGIKRDSTERFFNEQDDEESDSSSGSSFEGVAFPNIDDWQSDHSSIEAPAIDSPVWSRSVLNLFESFSDTGDQFDIHMNAGDTTEPKLAKVDFAPSTEEPLSGAGSLEAIYEQYISELQPINDTESVSTMLSDASTFCLEENMVQSGEPMTADSDISNVADISVINFTKKSFMLNEGHTENDSLPERDSDRCNERNVIPSSDKSCLSQFTLNNVEEAVDGNLCAVENALTLAGTQEKGHSSSQMSDCCLHDSGFHETEDAVDSSQSNEISQRHLQIQARIVEVLQQIEQSINNGIALSVRKKPSWQTCTMENGILQSNSLSQTEKVIKPIECRRLQLMVCLLASIYQLLATGTSCTKRELYYLHLELAQSPSYTYAVLDDVCALLDVDAWEANVFNTSKGLIAGALVITLSCGRTVDCNGRWGTSVPLDVGSVVELRITAKLVLVVEKDTVFKRLLEDGILDKFPYRLLLVTGKGYPDVSTRLLLKKIADWCNVPICGLMDGDPHGIEILCVYKFGSLAMAYQQQSLAVSSMRWIGVFPSDVELLGLQGVSLRENELKRIEHMLKRPYIEGNLKRELMLLRQLSTKAEIESLYNIASDYVITVYLPQKLKDLRLN